MSGCSPPVVGVLVRPPQVAPELTPADKKDDLGPDRPRIRIRRKTAVRGGIHPPSPDEGAANDMPGQVSLPIVDHARSEMSEAHDEEDSAVHPAAELLGLLCSERDKAVSMLRLAPSAFQLAHGSRCPLCPWFKIPAHRGQCTETQLVESHAPTTNYVASGTKQVRVCMALFEADVFLGRLRGEYLSRSSELLRAAVQPPPGPRVQKIDRHIRVVLDAVGPTVVSQLRSKALPVRRVGNVLYTRPFADALLRDQLVNRDGLAASLSRMQQSFLLQGSELGSLMPEHPKTMWPLVADILGSAAITAWNCAMARNAFSRGEYKVVICDGTMKVAMALMGYRRDRGLQSPDPAWSDEERRTRILTLRGATGFVLGMPLVRDEAGSTIARELAAVCGSQEHREAVEFLVVDVCSEELLAQMRAVFPNLRCVCEDPVHLVMKVKSSTGNRASKASAFLARIMAKFSLPWVGGGLPDDGAWPWVWQAKAGQCQRCVSLLASLKARDLNLAAVAEAVATIDAPGPWRCRDDYVQALAALATLHSDDMLRRVGKKGKNVRGVLVAACAHHRWGSYRNNAYMRTLVQSGGILGVGTTANEALHAELRSALRQVYQVHLPTLQLRLDLITLAKRVAWEAAVRVPGLVQRRQHAVLCRVLARPLLDPAMWEPATSSGSHAQVAKPAEFAIARKAHALRVRHWVRMTVKKRAAITRKRTVFSTTRGEHLIGGGRGWGRKRR